MTMDDLLLAVVPNLAFAAVYVLATNRWIERGLTSLENRVKFLETALTNCLDRRDSAEGESAKREP